MSGTPNLGGANDRAALIRRLSAQRKHSAPTLTEHREAALSQQQQAIWLAEARQARTAAYNVNSVWRLAGRLDAQALAEAVRDLCRRHDALRCAFTVASGEPRQEVLDTLPELEIVELTDASEVNATLEARSAIPFDLTTPPLLRATLLRLDDLQHVLQIVTHHIVSDGWSRAVIARDLARAYAARAEGAAPEWPPLRFRYLDYARWQAEPAQAARAEPHLAYWRERLQHLTPLRLPFEATQRTHRLGYIEQSLPADLEVRIEQQAHAHGVTRYVLMLAAYQLLLGRYAGQDDVSVGSPLASRSQPGSEDLVGCFAGNVVMRLDLSGDPSVAELLQRAKAMVLDAMAHQDAPLQRVLALTSSSHGSGSGTSATFAFQDTPTTPLALPGVDAAPISMPSFDAKFDLALHVLAQSKPHHLRLDYACSHFSQQVAERLLQHFMSLLSGLCADADAPISALSLHSAAERRAIVEARNKTARAYPREASLAERFAATLQTEPEAVAISDGHHTVSFRRLDARTNQIANALMDAGARPGDIVAVALPRSTAFVAAVLGVIKAGCAYLPIDTAAPEAQVRAMLDDAQVQIVIAEEAAAYGRTCLHPDRLDADSTPPPPRGDGDSAAYVMYTSGTTGEPKGAVISHRAVISLVTNTDYLQVAPGDRVAHLSNVAFDAATFEIWGPLLNGGRIVIGSREESLEPARFAAFLESNGITSLFLTTALFNLHADAQPAVFSGLNHVLFGGEAADSSVVARVQQAGPPEHLINIYGPTECTTFSTAFEVPPGWAADQPVPIGRPIANTRAYVLDAAQQPVPDGVAGELYIAGDGLANGYLNAPQRTAERFMPCPFEPGVQMYRTGDRCRWNVAGQLVFMGRGDRQVKLSGYRIELGEIEATLEQHPAVARASVEVIADESGRRSLAAWVVASRAQELRLDDVRAHLRAQLPGYMQPRFLSETDNSQINANGKLALQTDAMPTPAQTSESAMRRSQTVRTLALIWAELLDLPHVNASDHFFAVGGDSLALVRLQSRIEETFGIAVPLRECFANPTVEALAQLLDNPDQQKRGQTDDAANASEAAARDAGSGYLIELRSGAGAGQVVSIGAQVRELLAVLPTDAGMYQLSSGKEDPVRFHRKGLARTAQIYAEALFERFAGQPTVLVGYSYSGLLALEISRRYPANENLHVVLLEPSSPGARAQPGKRPRVRQLFRALRRPRLSAPPSEALNGAISEEDALWYRIEATLRRNVRKAALGTYDGRNVTFVGSEVWFERRFEHFEAHFSSAPHQLCLGDVSHEDVVDDIACVRAWTRSVLALLRDSAP